MHHVRFANGLAFAFDARPSANVLLCILFSLTSLQQIRCLGEKTMATLTPWLLGPTDKPSLALYLPMPCKGYTFDMPGFK